MLHYLDKNFHENIEDSFQSPGVCTCLVVLVLMNRAEIYLIINVLTLEGQFCNLLSPFRIAFIDANVGDLGTE